MVKGRIMRNLKRMLVTLGFLFLTANWAMAGNNVQLQTDVPDIPKSSCDQAGNIVMLFESGAKLEEGDTITFSLSNNVTVCKAIDFFLRLADTGSEQLLNDTSYPVYDTSGTASVGDWLYTRDSDTNALYSTLTDGGSQFDVGFKIYAPVGSQTITLTLGRRIASGTGIGQFYSGNMPGSTNGKFSLTYQPDENDNKMVIRLFDQKTVAPFFLKENSPLVSGTQYTDAFLSTDDHMNALCINTSSTAFTAEYVFSTPKSTVANDAYKLSFTGDYYVAHITTGDSYSLGLICKDECPTVSIGTSTDQWGNVTTPSGTFDPGNYISGVTSSERWYSSGTCTLAYGNGIRLSRSGANFQNSTKYAVTCQIYINGSAANASTIYWDSANTGGGAYMGTSSDSGKCAAAGTAWSTAASTGWVRDSSDLTKTTTTVTAGAAHDSFMLDLPEIDYVYTNLKAGDEIQVMVTFGKYPCGAGTSTTVCLAKIVSSCPTSSTYELIFPFAKNKLDPSFWTALGVMNLSSATATVTINLYDATGGSGTLSNVSIMSNGMYAVMVPDIINNASFVKSTSPAFDETADLIIKVGSESRLDGICFVGSNTGQLMHGYLPRVFNNSSPMH
jgi:hypothetical protein